MDPMRTRLVGTPELRAPEPTAEAIQAIRKAVIQAKWDLSDSDETEIRVGGYRQAPSRARSSRR